MFPKILYIYKEDPDEEESWFVAAEEIEGCANQHGSTLIGTYELKEVQSATLVVKLELKSTT